MGDNPSFFLKKKIGLKGAKDEDTLMWSSTCRYTPSNPFTVSLQAIIYSVMSCCKV